MRLQHNTDTHFDRIACVCFTRHPDVWHTQMTHWKVIVNKYLPLQQHSFLPKCHSFTSLVNVFTYFLCRWTIIQALLMWNNPSVFFKRIKSKYLKVIMFIRMSFYTFSECTHRYFTVLIHGFLIYMSRTWQL